MQPISRQWSTGEKHGQFQPKKSNEGSELGVEPGVLSRSVHAARVNFCRVNCVPIDAHTVLAVSHCVEHDGTSYAVLKHVEVGF